MASTKKKLRMRKKFSPKDGASKVSQTVLVEASPDSKCPICLDKFNNMAHLDRCLHKFCFRCIHEWSKNKAECPLCKQPFNSIFHTVKAEDDFKEFVLRPTENGSFGSPDGHRFRYRTTLTRERRQFNPPRRTSPPPDNGVMFESLSSASAQQHNRGIHRMMLRLAARRRAQIEGRSVRHMREQEIINFRRALYRTGVRVRSVRDGGRYRDISAEFFQRNPACLHRLVPWLKRELTVLYGAHGSLVNIVQHIIMSRITRYNMEDQAIQDELRPFLLTRTDHFLHEFISFARSPYNMDAYDQHAIYDCPAPSYEEGSSSDSSVITISADEADSGERNRPSLSVAGSGLSQAPWDDETPGPSYSTVEQVQLPSRSVSESESESSREEERAPGPSRQQSNQVKTDPASNEGGNASSGEEDCVIVGYVKPMAERTPELVQLSSDSEESVNNETAEVPEQPEHIRFCSISPPSTVCSSLSKDKSPDRCDQSSKMLERKDQDRSSFGETERQPSERRSSPSADRERASREKDRSSSKHYSKDRHAYEDDRRRHRQNRSRDRTRSRSKERSHHRSRRRSRSRERSWSVRSPTISINSDSTLSRSRQHSRSRSRDYPSSRDAIWPISRDKDYSYSRHNHEKSYSYHWDSYSRYSRDRDNSDSLYVQNRSYYTSYCMSPGYGACSRSRSRSRSSHRDSHHRRERRRSRTLSSTSSRESHGAHRRSRLEKPSGKRKYKTRHLEATSKDKASKSHVSSSSSLRERKENSERHHKKSRRKSRSPSVEIVYEGKATGESRRHHKKKKKHKKKSRRHRSKDRAPQRSPTVITIDSDSDGSVRGKDCQINENEVSTTTGSCAETTVPETSLQVTEERELSVDQDSHGDVVKTEAASVIDGLISDKCDIMCSVIAQTSFALEGDASSSSPSNARERHSLEQRDSGNSTAAEAGPLATGSQTECPNESPHLNHACTPPP
nr:PREDICTED: E3 ubiquitin-protein ligase Topors [Lepisosteus oculatus]XP_015201412.1 PREDICTED: E3 ubiquitin-protein ligase Topors [Lepisosteus oculatus]XP_015201413.1 PREDICTED: E3 ubiquitin-protein ligase Topors [Lepisosteus oculatus]XP_015201414.1 PREDICTED: E3 ubiquitin-protein ligase Topors [Lepisosteus oculatus]